MCWHSRINITQKRCIFGYDFQPHKRALVCEEYQQKGGVDEHKQQDIDELKDKEEAVPLVDRTVYFVTG